MFVCWCALKIRKRSVVITSVLQSVPWLSREPISSETFSVHHLPLSVPSTTKTMSRNKPQKNSRKMLRVFFLNYYRQITRYHQFSFVKKSFHLKCPQIPWLMLGYDAVRMGTNCSGWNTDLGVRVLKRWKCNCNVGNHVIDYKIPQARTPDSESSEPLVLHEASAKCLVTFRGKM